MEPPQPFSLINPPGRVAAIVNPASGSPHPILHDLNVALAAVEWTVDVTKAVGDGIRFARQAAENGAELVIAYGGDGTLLEVINGLAGTGIPLLVLRGGTGNLIADELGLPDGIPETLEILKQPEIEVRSMDLGLMNRETYFLLRCGCGLEVEALRKTEYGAKADWGKLAYIQGFLKALTEQESIDFSIWIDDAVEPVTESGVALTVANAGSIGLGTLQIAPDVSICDGLLDVCLIEKAAVKTAIEFFTMNSEKVDQLPDLSESSLLRHQKARRVRIETAQPVKFQADGDLVGVTPLEIEVCPNAVWVVSKSQ